MRAGILYIFSDLHQQSKLKKAQEDFFSTVTNQMQAVEIKGEDYSACDFILVTILTGGTENKFSNFWPNLKDSQKPFAIVAFNSDNSLPAAMEIQSWLRKECKYDSSTIIHGNLENIARKIKETSESFRVLSGLKKEVMGVIGEPSDWLIASKANYRKLEQKFGLRFNLIPMKEFRNILENLREHEAKSFEKAFSQFKTSENTEEFKKAADIYLALKKTLSNYCLTTLTIRCFDILDVEKTTGCLPLALLNDEGITAGCEGDVPAALSMLIGRHVSKQPAFMANPSRVEGDKAVFAHCTAPCAMLKNFKIDTHFESGIGLAVSGEFSAGPVTLFKIDGDAEHYALAEGEIMQFTKEENLCRTQIKVNLPGAEDYMLHRPLGNHQILIQGHHAKALKDLCNLWNLKPVWKV